MSDRLIKSIVSIFFLLILFGIKSCLSVPDWPEGPDAYKIVQKWDKSLCEKVLKRYIKSLEKNKHSFNIIEIGKTSTEVIVTFQNQSNVSTYQIDIEKVKNNLINISEMKAFACLCEKTGRHLVIRYHQWDDRYITIDLPFSIFK